MTDKALAKAIAKAIAKANKPKVRHGVKAPATYNPQGVTGIAVLVTYAGAKKPVTIACERRETGADGTPYASNVGFFLPEGNALNTNSAIFVKRSVVAPK